ncbi:hypothetical protein B0T17DRAFT_505609 [Bombardia bombarda]|uniref:Uncharacterized protein n=1 Tax=Bombardia bombarda TaxID=252184 RepID=A0AA39X7Z8_9PEZI|nr:hypothetical protein B0T17DRAFT_505609 [Bombardia bombarda]
MTTVAGTRQSRTSDDIASPAMKRTRSRSPQPESRSTRPYRKRSRSRSPIRSEREDEDRRARHRHRHHHDDDNRRGGDRNKNEIDKPKERSHNEPSSSRRHHHHHRHHRDHHETHAVAVDNGNARRRSTERNHFARRERKPDNDSKTDVPVELPFGARKLSSRHDFGVFEPLLGHYLELHKSLDLSALDEAELRGRWKSFVGKWNRGELPDGWYDPELFARVAHDAAEDRAEEERLNPTAAVVARESSVDDDDDEGGGDRGGAKRQEAGVASPQQQQQQKEPRANNDDNSDDSDYGPSLPPSSRPGFNTTHSATLPHLQDLALRRELDDEERAAALEDLRFARRADRRQQKEQLDELVPRADAGTRERKLEKRAAVNDKMRAFRDPSPGAAEVPESELLGEGDGITEHKRMVATMQQKVSERQSRREEDRRAKAAERDERIQAFRAREEKTIETLKELARRRFG